MANHRYAGISPYTSEQKNVFFGRDEDIDELHEKILLEKQVLLYSKSGVGKSSIVNAGVLPKLTASNEYQAVKIRFSAYNEKDFVTPITKVVHELSSLGIDLKQKSVLEDISPSEKPTLWYYLKKIQLINEEIKPVLIFDQFEELFSYPEKYIEEFKSQLAEILKPEVPTHFVDLFAEARSENRELMSRQTMNQLNKNLQVKVVYIIRSDRLSELNSLRDRIPDIQKSYYELFPLNNSQAREAIVKPAQKDGEFESTKFEYDEKAIDKILSFLTNNYTQEVETTQLQIICHRIEMNTISKNNNLVKAADIPDFKNIFFDFYANSIGDVSKDQQANARKLVEDEMIRDGQRISLDGRLCLDYLPEEELHKLVNNHLLRAERNTVGGFSYEISHDTLVEPIYEAAKARRQNEELKKLQEERQARYLENEKKRKRQLRVTFLVSSIAVVAFILMVVAIAKDSKAEREIKKFNELYSAISTIDTTDDVIVEHYWQKANESFAKYDYRQALIELLMAVTKFSSDTPFEIQDSSTTLYYKLIKYKNLYQEGLNYFYDCNFTGAENSFSTIYQNEPGDSLSLFYAKACGDFTKDDMVLVEGGSFIMGNDGSISASPAHKVLLSDFYISKYEVTNAQYARFLTEYVKNREENGEEIDSIDLFVNWNGVEAIKIEDRKVKVEFGYENKPAAWISWYGAKAFCDFYNLSLPTEAQWEYAARGGNQSQGYTYSGGYYIEQVAEYFGNNGISTAPVTNNNPNELGLYNMSGNLWEWCSDWYDEYSSQTQTNPKGPVSGEQKVNRGGGWSDGEEYCRVYSRFSWPPYPAGYFMGFRVVLNP
jgi:formylglycine-generating enzyme required for sulfatase activity